MTLVKEKGGQINLNEKVTRFVKNKNNFIKIIQKSDALKFLENPQEFLNNLKTGNI